MQDQAISPEDTPLLSNIIVIWNVLQQAVRLGAVFSAVGRPVPGVCRCRG